MCRAITVIWRKLHQVIQVILTTSTQPGDQAELMYTSSAPASSHHDAASLIGSPLTWKIPCPNSRKQTHPFRRIGATGVPDVTKQKKVFQQTVSPSIHLSQIHCGSYYRAWQNLVLNWFHLHLSLAVTPAPTTNDRLGVPHTTLTTPGSKSMSNRALVFAALSNGTAKLENPLRWDPG